MRACWTSVVATGLAIAIAIGAGDARADDASAPALFKRAQAEYARGEYRAAAEDFDVAYVRDPRGASAYNGAQAWEAAGEPARAADDLARALASSDLDASFAAAARVRLAQLDATLARVEVLAPADARVSIGAARDATTPLRLHLAAGTHALRVARADGREETRSIQVAPGESRTVVIEAPAATPAAPAAAPSEPAAAPEGSSARATWGWIALGAGAAIGAASVALLLDATSAAHEYEDEHAQRGIVDSSLRDRASLHLTMSRVGGAAAVVAAGAGACLLLWRPSGATRVALGAGTIAVGGEF